MERHSASAHSLNASLPMLLKEAGLSREGVADHLGVSTQTIHNWCRHRNPIGVRQLQSLYELLVVHGVSQANASEFVIGELRSQGLSDSVIDVQSAITTAQIASKTFVIAVWHSADFAKTNMVATTCRDTLEHLGHRCMVVDCGRNHSYVQVTIEQSLSLEPNGVLLLIPGQLPDPQRALVTIAEPLYSAGIPVVFGPTWDGPVELPDRAAAIAYDSAAVARMAAETLEKFGHKRIAGVFSASGAIDNAIARFFMDELEQRAMELSSLVWRGNYQATFEMIQNAALQSTALFVDSPLGLPVVADALTVAGLQWPDDINVLGVGCSEFRVASGWQRSITILDVPFGQLGRKAAGLLLKLAGQGKLSETERFYCLAESDFALIPSSGGSMSESGGPVLGAHATR